MPFVRSSAKFETLWIFKVARWTHARCLKINQSSTVSNDIQASSSEIWTANLAQSLTVGTLTNSRRFVFGDSNWKFCKVGYPVGAPKPNIQMWTFLTWIFFFCFLIFSEKNQNLLDNIQEHCIRKQGKIQSELKLLFGVHYWFFKLYTGIIWHSYFPLQRISSRKGSGWSGAKWVKQ